MFAVIMGVLLTIASFWHYSAYKQMFKVVAKTLEKRANFV